MQSVTDRQTDSVIMPMVHDNKTELTNKSLAALTPSTSAAATDCQPVLPPLPHNAVYSVVRVRLLARWPSSVQVIHYFCTTPVRSSACGFPLHLT